MNHETELKLRVPEGSAASIRRSPLLSALRQGPGARRHLLTVYYDTPSLALARQGVSLRVRHADGRRVQGVKLPGNGHGLVRSRPEIETEIEGDSPDLDRIPDEEVRRKLSEAAAGESLTQAFVSEIGRTTWPVRLGDSEIEVALDEGEIRAGADRSVPVSEVELELKSGRADKLIELALALGRSVPISVERSSKAARGLALVTGLGAQPARAAAVQLVPEITVRDAFLALARSCLAQLGANEAAVMAGDPEGVHQMRVAARRLRALLSSFRELLSIRFAEELQAELRWLMQALGPARDLDVFMAETLEPLLRSSPDEKDIAALFEAAQRRAGSAHEDARAAIATPRYTEFLLTADLRFSSGDWATQESDIDQAMEPLARGMLRRRCRQLVRLAQRRDPGRLEDFHQIRIAAKKLRYAGEFFRSLYSRKLTRRYLARLSRLQDRLGGLNDAVTGRMLLEQLLPETGLEWGASERVAGLVIGWQTARVDADLAAFAGEWEEFRALRSFWSR